MKTEISDIEINHADHMYVYQHNSSYKRNNETIYCNCVYALCIQ